MLGYMNQQVMQLEYDCSKFDSYDDISQDVLEGRMMEYLYQPSDKKAVYYGCGILERMDDIAVMNPKIETSKGWTEVVIDDDCEFAIL